MHDVDQSTSIGFKEADLVTVGGKLETRVEVYVVDIPIRPYQ